jgi:hypothetical protein
MASFHANRKKTMRSISSIAALCLWSILPTHRNLLAVESCWPGYVPSPEFAEQTREIRFADQARAIVNTPLPHLFERNRPTQLVFYATPNGNSVEQTLGCKQSEGLDWHFDIQHVMAQVRTFRAICPSRNIVLACIQANNRSWPTWRRQREANSAWIAKIVQSLADTLPADEVKLTLSGHSGGGSFLFGLLNATDKIPSSIERIIFLDANYNYSDEQLHGTKILDWLAGDPVRQFVVLAYDDRNIEYKGKKVVGPTGGTFRASHRMLDFLRGKIELEHSKQGVFDRYAGINGRLLTLIHPNPENKILHTRLVGEMNGLLFALTAGTAEENEWGKLDSPRDYTDMIQPQPYDPATWHGPAPALPARQVSGLDGAEFFHRGQEDEQARLEQTAVREILSGNMPSYLRNFVDIRASATFEDGGVHEIVYRVMPDYLAVGSDQDFFRLPLTPLTAQHLADMMGCVLPTKKMVDAIYSQATVRLEPHPLTESREALATFWEHHQIIERQRQGHEIGTLLGGIKKDVVVTNRLTERPNRVAIYGWHQMNGKPIQPLTTVHVDWYVDYSHGVRLVDQWATVDGQPMRIKDVLRDPKLSQLLSDEGPIPHPHYTIATDAP